METEIKNAIYRKVKKFDVLRIPNVFALRNSFIQHIKIEEKEINETIVTTCALCLNY